MIEGPPYVAMTRNPVFEGSQIRRDSERLRSFHMLATGPDRGEPDAGLVLVAQMNPESEEARRAASLLLSRYRDRVYAWCYRRLRDPERALDAAQEVLLSAYRHLASFEPHARFSTWLYVIARNRCLSELRRRSLTIDDETDPDVLRDPDPDPEQAYGDRMSEEAVLDLIRNRLEPQEQDVLWLRCFEHMPIDRITSLLRIEQASGARGVLQRARRRLREALAEGKRSGGQSP